MAGKQATDHLGQTFPSIAAMCKHWNISAKRYDGRIRSGWSVEKALTTTIHGSRPMTKKTWTDHEGNVFPSLVAMAEHWNISKSTLQNRLITMKMPIEDALTMTNADVKKYYQHGCTDHKGNRFESKAKMCEFYKIPRQVYFGRKALGWTEEQALTTPVNGHAANFKSITYKGKYYKTTSEFCDALNLTRSTFNLRVKQMKKKYSCDNLTDEMIDEILAMPTKNVKIIKQKCIDFEGNEFPSLNAMCNHYGITRATYSSRIDDYGWDQKRALTTPVVVYGSDCSDGMGHTFPTLVDMCHFYNIPTYRFHGHHLTEDETKEFILNNKYKPGTQINENLIICRMITFPYFRVKLNGQSIVLSFEEIIKIQHEKFNPLPKRKVKNIPIEIHECVGFPNYRITTNGESNIWTYWQIINYVKEKNYGLSV